MTDKLNKNEIVNYCHKASPSSASLAAIPKMNGVRYPWKKPDKGIYNALVMHKSKNISRCE